MILKMSFEKLIPDFFKPYIFIRLQHIELITV